MMRHMIGTDRTRELRVPKNSHDLGKVHLALIGINLREIVKTAANVAHVDLVNLLSLTQVLNDGQDFSLGVLQPLGGCPQAQLKPIIRTVHDRFVAFKGCED